MSEITKYLRRAIVGRSKGGMQTGVPKITMPVADIERVEKQRDELAAHVERLRSEILRAMDKANDKGALGKRATIPLHTAALQTPKQSLAEKYAEVARKSFIAAINLVRENPERANHAVYVNQKANEYAQREYGVKDVES